MLRRLGIPEEELVYDAHDLRIETLPQAAGTIILLREEIGEEPGDPALWRRTRRDGSLRHGVHDPASPTESVILEGTVACGTRGGSRRRAVPFVHDGAIDAPLVRHVGRAHEEGATSSTGFCAAGKELADRHFIH